MSNAQKLAFQLLLQIAGLWNLPTLEQKNWQLVLVILDLTVKVTSIPAFLIMNGSCVIVHTASKRPKKL